MTVCPTFLVQYLIACQSAPPQAELACSLETLSVSLCPPRRLENWQPPLPLLIICELMRRCHLVGGALHHSIPWFHSKLAMRSVYDTGLSVVNLTLPEAELPDNLSDTAPDSWVRHVYLHDTHHNIGFLTLEGFSQSRGMARCICLSVNTSNSSPHAV